jgi:hypothetical protein
MNETAKMSEEEASASVLVADAYKDLVKGTISLPLEACKSMATGCATVAGLYGAVVAFVNYGHAPQASQWQVYVILAPFVLLAIAGLRFGTAYLPNVGLPELLASNGHPGVAKSQQEQLIARELFIRKRIVTGSAVFWFAVVWALLCVAFVRVPQ